METIRIMSVGRSGVGKSTIGNMFLHGNYEGTFKRSSGSTFCTDMSLRRKSEKGDVEYIDVPGIPCTDPNNTKRFHDIVISETNKGVDVILFVFKRGREDPEAYNSAGVTFRELNKCSAVKILVINDFNSYDIDVPPKEADFEGQMERIATLTKIDFSHRMTFNSKTMSIKLNGIKSIKPKKTERESEHLRNLTEQAVYVEGLEKDFMHNLRKIRFEEECFSYYQTVNPIWKGAAYVSASVYGLSVLFSWVTGGAARPISTVSLLTAGVFASLHKINTTNLSKTEDKISKLKQQNIEKDLQTATKAFEELKKVLGSPYV